MGRTTSISKRLARSVVTGICRLSSVLGRAERQLANRLTILCYHRVLPAERKKTYFLPDLVVTPESLRLHCEVLRRHFEVLTLHDAYASWSAGSRSERPLAAITFDDGYRDNLTFAAPVLQEFALPATFFVIAGLLGSQTPPWYDYLGGAIASNADEQCRNRVIALLKRFDVQDNLTLPDRYDRSDAYRVVAAAKTLPSDRRGELIGEVCNLVGEPEQPKVDDRIMDFQELAQLRECGHEIGSHSLSHEILTLLDETHLAQEVGQSKHMLEAGLGAQVSSFCYPNGDYNAGVVRAVDHAGYQCAVSTGTRLNDAATDRFALNRTFVHEDRLTGIPRSLSPYLLRMEICGLYDRYLRRHHAATG